LIVSFTAAAGMMTHRAIRITLAERSPVQDKRLIQRVRFRKAILYCSAEELAVDFQ
jgi:hypothetical protein